MRLLVPIQILVFCCLTHLATAQYEQADDGFAFRLISPNHQYLINNNLTKNEFGLGLEFEYLSHINSFLNFSIPFRLSQAKLPIDDVGNLRETANVGLDALIHFKYCKEPKFVYPHLYSGVGGVLRDQEDFGVEVPVGIGLNFRLSQHFYLSTKGEYRFGFDDRRDHIQVGAGFLFLMGPGTKVTAQIVDRDGDGVIDSEDLCPHDAGVVALNGCPDSDNDGIADGEDQCPTIAGLVSLSGCPDTDADGIGDPDDDCPNEAGPAENKGCPVLDADGDGVPDATDACPNVAGSMATQGCPDNDSDGIADQADKCPNEAGTMANQGCPDSDGDGIIDGEDRCPNTAGIRANNGCPEIEQEDQEKLEFAMSAVQFETANATLKQVSYQILDEIIDIMKRYPDYKLRISGHTDSIGSSRTNQSLSEKRAKSCYDYFLAKEINASRISYEGLGETKPIADNRYKAGRDQNRRVEFDLYLE